MDNDIPEDDKTIIGGGETPADDAASVPPVDAKDDPFAVTPEEAEPTPVDTEMEAPGAAVEDMPDAADPVLEPEPEPEVAATPEPKEIAADQTIIAGSEADVPAPEPAVPPVTDAEPTADQTILAGSEADTPAVTPDAAEVDDVPAAVPLPQTPAHNPNDPVPVGTMINNNYEIKELISAGGMGEVFRGANAFTGDAVAIKIVLQSLANDPKIAALFMREAKVLCGLSDQAIVRYYNFVRDADLDRFCLIMEFIDGVSLSDFTRNERPLTSDEARDLMRKVARGLERAHEMDVVHRDLSPDNVMLRDGDVATPVLIDFGIAKSTEMAENTLHGQLAGKFKYISPEQLGHFGGGIGPRTDIYGLGLLIAAAVRGEPLDMGSSVVEAVNARSKIPDLDGVPEDLKPILSHMLEPDPADRPAHMADVIQLLDEPGTLPPQYGGSTDWDLPNDAPERTVIAQTAQPVTQPQGLRQPPGATQNTGLPPVTAAPSFVPGQGNTTSASPFGATTGIPPGQMAGVTAPPTTNVPGLSVPPTTMAPTTPPRRRKKRGDGGGIGGALRWVAALALIGGLGGYVAFTQGLLPESLTGIVPADDTPRGVEDDVAQTENGPVTRRSFLAGFDAGACAYAGRVAAGPNTGTIAAFSGTAGAYAGLQDAFEGTFDSRPAVQERVVTSDQCAVLDLARKLQSGDGTPPILTLDADSMTSGGSIVGRLNDRRGRPVWLILVTTAGGVYNLTDRMAEQADGSATFSFGLNSSGSGGAEPQLIMAVVTDKPLIAASAATNGARASSLLPLIEAEILGEGGTAGAAVSYFDLLP